MLTEELKEHFALLRAQYPKVKPCINCHYWHNTSRGENGFSRFNYCKYLEEEGVPRGCLPDLKNHTCKRFKPKQRKKKTKKQNISYGKAVK